MTALYVILAIIALIIILFCIKVKVTAIYDESFTFDVQWLFIKKRIYPQSQKDKDKKEEKERKKKLKKDKKVKEPKPQNDSDTSSGTNIFSDFYHNQGFDAVLNLIKTAAKQLGGFLKGVYKAFTIENLTLLLKVCDTDAAQTAIKYGKVCSAVYPSMGFIVSNMRVKQYDVNVVPDFINNSNEAIFKLKLSVIPIRLTNAVIVLVFRLFFKVLLKLLKGSKKDNKNKTV